MVSLNPYEAQRRQELTEKLRTRNLTKIEAQELRNLLEKERDGANTLGDVIAAIAIGFLIALVIAYLADDNRWIIRLPS